jgi:hypothetical protein
VAVTKGSVVLAQAHANFEQFLVQRQRTLILEAWRRGEQDRLSDRYGIGLSEIHDTWRPGVYTPPGVNDEYLDLANRSTTPWAGLVVKSLQQMVYVDGVSRKNSKETPKVWETWQRNEWDAWQISLHGNVIGHGLAFGTVMPSKDPLTGDKMARMAAHGADKMAAFYDDPQDQWPTFAMRAEEVRSPFNHREGWFVFFYDETATHRISCNGDGRELSDWTYIDYEEHPFPVPPVVRYANHLDLNGRATGEVEPVIPMLRRIDQGTFDRLITQRFGAWKIRYIAGMAKPTRASDATAEKMRLRLEDLLVAEDKDTKFGTLDASDLKQFIETGDSDLRALSAITQTPPHHLLGVSANLQAEALAAAEAGLLRKAGDFQTICGESHEKMLRLTALANGDTEEARAVDLEVKWRDTESRSLVQTINALSLAATGLKIPVEMLWERVPGWTDQMTERAKELIESGDLIDMVLAELQAEQNAEAAKQMSEAVPPEDRKPTGTQGSNGQGGSNKTSKPVKQSGSGK